MASIEVQPPAPYSLAKTIGAFARFPQECVDIVAGDRYRRLFPTGEHTVLIEASQSSSDDLAAPVMLRVLNEEHLPDSAVKHALGQARRLLSLDEPIDQVRGLLQSDPRLARLDRELVGLRRVIDPSPFEGLVSSILAQQISIRGAAVVRARLVQHFGRSLEVGDQRYWAFPEPKDVVDSSVDELCSLKMTSAKARAILAVADAAVQGCLDADELRQLGEEDVIEKLIALPGIGPWTAHWFLVNVLGRMSFVPVGDLGVRRSTGNWLLDGELPSSDTVRALYEPFGDHRAYVAYYVLSAERFGLTP